jgi:hypothetical protein
MIQDSLFSTPTVVHIKNSKIEIDHLEVKRVLGGTSMTTIMKNENSEIEIVNSKVKENEHLFGVLAEKGKIEIRNSSFEGLGNGNKDGGVLSLHDTIAKIYDSKFINNTALKGGAIFSEISEGMNDVKTEISNTTFENNTA